MNQPSDEHIVEKVLEGEKDLFGVLLERYQRFVYRIALSYLRDCDRAEDATQEAFLIAYENLDRLRDRSVFASWIAGITKNVCRNVIKRAPPSVSLGYLAELRIEPSDSGFPGATDGKDHELIALVRKLLPEMPQIYREVLELYYTEEQATKTIAQFLGISQGAVITRLHRARKLLEKMIEKEER